MGGVEARNGVDGLALMGVYDVESQQPGSPEPLKFVLDSSASVRTGMKV